MVGPTVLHVSFFSITNLILYFYAKRFCIIESEDYIYVLNLDNMRWSTKQILPPYRAVMTRSNHAGNTLNFVHLIIRSKNQFFLKL